MPDPRLKTYAPQAVRHLAAAGNVLAGRQEKAGALRGNVPPWPGSDDADFHGTLAAVWIWARHQRLSGSTALRGRARAAWGFVGTSAPRFVPDAIDSAAGDEAAYDCALVAAGGGRRARARPRRRARQALADRAARVLSITSAPSEICRARV